MAVKKPGVNLFDNESKTTGKPDKSTAKVHGETVKHSTRNLQPQKSKERITSVIILEAFGVFLLSLAFTFLGYFRIGFTNDTGQFIIMVSGSFLMLSYGLYINKNYKEKAHGISVGLIFAGTKTLYSAAAGGYFQLNVYGELVFILFFMAGIVLHICMSWFMKSKLIFSTVYGAMLIASASVFNYLSGHSELFISRQAEFFTGSFFLITFIWLFYIYFFKKDPLISFVIQATSVFLPVIIIFYGLKGVSDSGQPLSIILLSVTCIMNLPLTMIQRRPAGVFSMNRDAASEIIKVLPGLKNLVRQKSMSFYYYSLILSLSAPAVYLLSSGKGVPAFVAVFVISILFIISDTLSLRGVVPEKAFSSMAFAFAAIFSSIFSFIFYNSRILASAIQFMIFILFIAVFKYNPDFIYGTVNKLCSRIPYEKIPRVKKNLKKQFRENATAILAAATFPVIPVITLMLPESLYHVSYYVPAIYTASALFFITWNYIDFLNKRTMEFFYYLANTAALIPVAVIRDETLIVFASVFTLLAISTFSIIMFYRKADEERGIFTVSVSSSIFFLAGLSFSGLHNNLEFYYQGLIITLAFIFTFVFLMIFHIKMVSRYGAASFFTTKSGMSPFIRMLSRNSMLNINNLYMILLYSACLLSSVFFVSSGFFKSFSGVIFATAGISWLIFYHRNNWSCGRVSYPVITFIFAIFGGYIEGTYLLWLIPMLIFPPVIYSRKTHSFDTFSSAAFISQGAIYSVIGKTYSVWLFAIDKIFISWLLVIAGILFSFSLSIKKINHPAISTASVFSIAIILFNSYERYSSIISSQIVLLFLLLFMAVKSHGRGNKNISELAGMASGVFLMYALIIINGFNNVYYNIEAWIFHGAALLAVFYNTGLPFKKSGGLYGLMICLSGIAPYSASISHFLAVPASALHILVLLSIALKMKTVYRDEENMLKALFIISLTLFLMGIFSLSSYGIKELIWFDISAIIIALFIFRYFPKNSFINTVFSSFVKGRPNGYSFIPVLLSVIFLSLWPLGKTPFATIIVPLIIIPALYIKKDIISFSIITLIFTGILFIAADKYMAELTLLDISAKYLVFTLCWMFFVLMSVNPTMIKNENTMSLASSTNAVFLSLCAGFLLSHNTVYLSFHWIFFQGIFLAAGIAAQKRLYIIYGLIFMLFSTLLLLYNFSLYGIEGITFALIIFSLTLIASAAIGMKHSEKASDNNSGD